MGAAARAASDPGLCCLEKLQVDIWAPPVPGTTWGVMSNGIGKEPWNSSGPFPQDPSLDVYKPGDVLSLGKKNIGTGRREQHDPHIPQPGVGAVSGKAQSVCVS